MDIEGAEYESLFSMSGSVQKRCRIIVIEFHTLHELWNLQLFNIASRAFEKILTTHSCVHIHPNNRDPIMTKDGIKIPRLLEFSFLRNDYIQKPTPATTFLHPLDSNKCDPEKYHYVEVPECWYRT